MFPAGALHYGERMSDDTTPPQPPEGAVPPTPPTEPPLPAYGSTPPPEGGFQPPPQQPQYGAPPAGAGGYDPVAAVKYGWATFTKSPATLLVPALVVILVVGVAQFVLQMIFSGIFLETADDCKVSITDTAISLDDCGGPSFFTTLFVAALVGAIGSFLAQILSAGLIRSALNIVSGQPALDVGGVFSWAGKPAVIQTAAIVAGLSFVGTFVFYVGAIAVAFLTAFAMYFAVDKDLAGIAAVKASASFMIDHIGSTIIFFLLAIAVVIAGVIACLVGIFVAIPVLIIAAAYTFRVLNNEPVAPVA